MKAETDKINRLPGCSAGREMPGRVQQALSSRDEVRSSRRPIPLEFTGQDTGEKKTTQIASSKDL